MINQKILLRFFSRKKEEEEERKNKKRKRIVQIDLITSQTRMQITDSTIDESRHIIGRYPAKVTRGKAAARTHVARGWVERWREGGSISNFPQRDGNP